MGQNQLMEKQVTVREINAHLQSDTAYCYVTRADGSNFRIARARTRNGVMEGRVINGSPKEWEMIPAGATSSLTRNELWIHA